MVRMRWDEVAERYRNKELADIQAMRLILRAHNP